MSAALELAAWLTERGLGWLSFIVFYIVLVGAIFLAMHYSDKHGS